MDSAEIRKTAIVAMFSDDELLETLVLKGGNALDLVHQLTPRGSYDIDFSMEGDFEDPDLIKEKIFRALRDRFDSAGMLVFDEKFGPKPAVRRKGMDSTWGGYRVEFKLIPKSEFAKFGRDIDALRRNAAVLGSRQERVFKIEISKYEYCHGKIETELDDFTVFVYSPEMIAIEKLRAICQQMPDYELNPHGHARARDFYDIYTVLQKTKVDLCMPQNLDLIRAIFAAKKVPIALLWRIEEYGQFHESDWPSVLQTVTERPQGFNFYFDFVVSEVERLKTVWKE